MCREKLAKVPFGDLEGKISHVQFHIFSSLRLRPHSQLNEVRATCTHEYLWERSEQRDWAENYYLASTGSDVIDSPDSHGWPAV
jgi:hypothetical protein